MNSFKELKCWQKGRDLRNEVSKLIKSFPSHEKFELISQMRRASRSVTHNIAEGFGRHHHQENIQFCRISRGSLNELIDQIDCAQCENYIDIETAEKIEKDIEEVIRILNGYINYLKKLT